MKTTSWFLRPNPTPGTRVSWRRTTVSASWYDARLLVLWASRNDAPILVSCRPKFLLVAQRRFEYYYTCICCQASTTRCSSTSYPYALHSKKLLRGSLPQVAENQEDLLAHPLVTSLLRNKWNSFGRWLYYMNLFIYCIFIVFLTSYVCTTKAPYLFKKVKDPPYE